MADLGQAVQRAERLLRRGIHRSKVEADVPAPLAPAEVVELAEARIRATGRGIAARAGEMYFDLEGLRVVTGELAASYRASRLRCRTIADLTCGVGGQVLAFAATCDRVLAVDHDRRRLGYARRNVRLQGRRNVAFLAADALSPAAGRFVRDADVLFADPGRRPGEPERSMETLLPPPMGIIDAHPGLADRAAFQLPTATRRERIPFPCEREILAIGGEVDRLTVYLGTLRRADRSVVLLPAGDRFAAAAPPGPDLPVTPPAASPGAMIADVHPGVRLADLLPEFLAERMPGVQVLDPDEGTTGTAGPTGTTGPTGGPRRRTLVTAEEIPASPFLVGRFRREAVVPFAVEDIRRAAATARLGTITLRLAIPPDEYWGYRSAIEAGLTGDRRGALFRWQDRAIVCSQIDARL